MGVFVSLPEKLETGAEFLERLGHREAWTLAGALNRFIPMWWEPEALPRRSAPIYLSYGSEKVRRRFRALGLTEAPPKEERIPGQDRLTDTGFSAAVSALAATRAETAERQHAKNMVRRLRVLLKHHGHETLLEARLARKPQAGAKLYHDQLSIILKVLDEVLGTAGKT